MLAQRIDLAVDEVRNSASFLLLGSKTMKAEELQACVDALDDLVLTIKFDAMRIERLAEEDSRVLRDIHWVMVDAVRQSGGTTDPKGGIAYIKRTIEALFPGDVLEP